jgi:tRNA pseudouridine55 synthase
MEGLLNIDKPGGMTSHDVVDRLRRVSKVRRVGHAGTLDPLATGVLLVCVGRTTRLVEYLVGQSKTYVTTVRLGQTTNTYDAEGEVVQERPFTHITPTVIEQTLAQFRGTIQQIPPLYSAIKKDGQPLYKLARRGEIVEVPAREVTLYELELLSLALPDVELRVMCSSGTYIRSLAHDLGEALGCGGHVARLRRTAVGDFSIEDATPLADLTAENVAAKLLPGDTAVGHLPRLDLPSADITSLELGQFVACQPDQVPAELARVYGEAGRFVGIVTAVEGQWRPKKIFHAADE